MRTKVTLVLLFLNVALFFFIVTFVRKWQTDQIWDQSRRRILGPETAVIQTLEIAGGRLAEPVRLEKRVEGWMLAKPIEWPANPDAVNRILNGLMLLEHESSFLVKDLPKSGLSLADYGLDKPKLTVTFTAGAAGAASGPLKTVTLRIGDATKVGNRLYVLSPDGERIHVVGRSLADNLSLTLDQLRADTIFNIPLFEVSSFNLQTAAPANLRIRLRRSGPLWSFEAPILTRADRLKVELAINGLDGLHTKAFFDPAALPPDQTGLGNPALRLTLEGNGRHETLLLGSPVPAAGPAPAANPGAAEAPAGTTTDYYAKMDDRAPVFTVAFPNQLFDHLRNAQEELRDRHLLSFDPRALTSITVAAPNHPELTLQRLETGQQPLDTDPWQIVTRAANQAPQILPADLPLVQRLIQKLYLLQALKFLRDAPQAIELENWGFNRPEREITLNLAARGTFAQNTFTAANTPSSVKLLIGVASEREGLAYAKLANEPFVYLVDPEILRETPVAVTYYRDRLLWELPAGAQITGLTLTDAITKTTLFRHRLAGPETWDQALATEPEARRAALLALIEQLRSLRAKSFVTDSFPASVDIAGEARPWKYAVEATLSLVGGSGAQVETRTLFFTERAGGGTQLAGSPQFNVVFEASQKLIDALFTLTYGPRDPGPAPAEPATAPAASPSPPAPAG
jgi:hypothetical protein